MKINHAVCDAKIMISAKLIRCIFLHCEYVPLIPKQCFYQYEHFQITGPPPFLPLSVYSNIARDKVFSNPIAVPGGFHSQDILYLVSL